MADSSWQPFENGSTLGQTGSEAGTIVRDEEHALGARISLERDTYVAPFAITCGIYGWMLHTRFFGSQEEAETQYDAMKQALAALLEAAEKTAESDGGRQVLMEGVSSFVEMFP
ncbi:MAG: hypothetical protein ACLQKY_16555 [Terracidiphilus sp.]